MRRASIIAGFLLTAVGGAASFIQVTPATVEMSVAPGRVKKGRIVVRNPRPVASLVQVELADGWAQETGQASLPHSEWFSLRVPKNFVIPAHGERVLKYRIKCPPQFSGETMAYVFFRLPPETARGGMSIQMGHAIPFYLSARGSERVELSITELAGRRAPQGALDLTVTLASEGNVHVRPRGEFTVLNHEGLELEKIPLAYGPPIFPGKTKQFYGKSEGARWSPGRYTLRVDVSYGALGQTPRTLVGEIRVRVTPDGDVLPDRAEGGR